MEGVPLTTYVACLTKVPVHLNQNPVRAFDVLGRMGPHVRAYYRARFGDGDAHGQLHDLPAKAFARLDADAVAKALHSVRCAMPSDAERVLKANPTVALAMKIRSSMWRWGLRRAAWNEIVDAYDGMRSFDAGVPGLEVTLDHTTWLNPNGWSEHSRTFLDGVFGFLLHWKGKHVMTIGFSISGGRRLLLQQVQLTERAGNRWLFKLPTGRLEFVIDRLRAAFPRHRIHVACGEDIVDRNLESYRRGVAARRTSIERSQVRPAAETKQTTLEHAEAVAKIEELHAKISHLEADRPRLAAFYRDAGRHAMDSIHEVNGIRHYAIAA